ncbi:hypothetical protein L484_015165 [Morus notabilis]|uniref:Defensin-like protein n=1 Tax=Morus notabilis TaxID=981085 RepID=W9S354_9ROSA|nr:hypothetical protein L484_015165 [Morus notabilis]
MAGFGVALNVPIACIGECSRFNDCHTTCVSRNYPKGGACMGFRGSIMHCCCNRGRLGETAAWDVPFA